MSETLDDLWSKCHSLWVLQGGETQEWNGDSCDCELIQGTYNCKAKIQQEKEDLELLLSAMFK